MNTAADTTTEKCDRCGREIDISAPEFAYWEATLDPDDGRVGTICEACITPQEQGQIDADAMGLTDEVYVRRAFAAWFRSGGTDQPAGYSDVEYHAGHRYVVLRNANGVLAVYRVRNDGMLKRLRRWPAELVA
jgi:hypothetical protein